jgi:prolyl oligopeptidase
MRWFALFCCFAGTAGAVNLPDQNLPPSAPVRLVEDDYFGTKIQDPYRWLENIKNDPDAQKWLKAQADYTRKMIDSMPGYEKLRARITELVNSEPATISRPRQLANGNLFYLKTASNQNTAKLCFRKSPSDSEVLLVDPDDFQKRTGVPYAINYFEPSWNGKYIAFGISAQGSEKAELHVVDTVSRKETGEAIPRCELNGVSWLPDEKHFLYIQLQELKPGQPATEKYFNSKIALHEVGSDPAKDEVYLTTGSNPFVPVRAEQAPGINTVQGSDLVFATVSNFVANEIAIFVAPLKELGPKTKWQKVADFDDQVTDFGVTADAVYLLTHKNAPRFKIVSRSVQGTELGPEKDVVPASQKVIQQIQSAKDGIYYTASDGVDCRLYRLSSTDPARPEAIPLPVTGWASFHDLEAGFVGNLDKPGVLVTLTSWTEAPSYYVYDRAKEQATELELQPPGPYDRPKDVVSREVKVKSHDGTLVPLSIVGLQNFKADGTHPVLLSGYGSYGIVSEPSYQPVTRVFLEHGFWLATAHVRGGGEYGNEWHRAGQKSSKPNTWKDFIAGAEYLINEKYAAKDKLAGLGGSAGGITIGRAITERPDLFTVALPIVGALDMLRFERTANGPPNIPEFGSVRDEDGFKALRAMSTYDHIRDGTAYPAILLYHGYNDPRVDVWMSAKAGARFQAATTSDKPVLLDIDYNSGHGIGNTRAQNVRRTTDMLAVMLWQFGDPNFRPTAQGTPSS